MDQNKLPPILPLLEFAKISTSKLSPSARSGSISYPIPSPIRTTSGFNLHMSDVIQSPTTGSFPSPIRSKFGSFSSPNVNFPGAPRPADTQVIEEFRRKSSLISNVSFTGEVSEADYESYEDHNMDMIRILAPLYGDLSWPIRVSHETVDLIVKKRRMSFFHDQQNGINHRRIFRFSSGQVELLERIFEKNVKPDRLLFEKISGYLKVELETIRRWFKNRRSKEKKQVCRSNSVAVYM